MNDRPAQCSRGTPMPTITSDRKGNTKWSYVER